MYKIEKQENGLENVQGFHCGAVNAGLRPDKNQGDVAFIRSDSLCKVSALFTSNTFQAAPIVHYKEYPKDFQSNFLLINAKNANAMTGKEGLEDIKVIMKALARKQNVHNPIMASTGVIGYRLPINKITSAFHTFNFSGKNSDETAKAIMTTDSFKKELSYKVSLENGESFTVSAICKGAGMINPAMATMLCFVITDASIPKEDMDSLLKEANENSFNKISVDGDTSTNDTVLLMANAMANTYHKEAFREVLNLMLFELSQMILRDGEGSNKVVAFEVKGAKSLEDAKKASMALSNSLLVKTALFGEDPNWGRIASTIGASNVACSEESLSIYYDDLCIYSNTQKELDKKREAQAYKIMKQESFTIVCDLGLGDFSYISYGCDLSYEYVKINAEYRT